MKKITSILVACALLAGTVVLAEVDVQPTPTLAPLEESAQWIEANPSADLETAAPTASLTASPTPDATASDGETAPEAETSATPSQADSSTDPAPTETPAPAETPAQTSGDAWMWVFDEITGETVRCYDDLLSLITRCEGSGTIYLSTEMVFALSDYTADDLAGISFIPDPDVFSSRYLVAISEEPFDDSTAREGTQVYICVLPESAAPNDNGEIAPEEIEILVTTTDYRAGAASTAAPSFVLGAIPAVSGYTFAVSVNGSDPVALVADSYVPDAPGDYSLRFLLLDAQGEVCARSAEYTFTLLAQEETPLPVQSPTPAPEGLAGESSSAGIMLFSVESPEIEIYASTTDYYPGELSDIAPRFTLYGLPDEEGYAYAVILDDAAPERLLSNQYTATREGDYTLRFVILDGTDTIVSRTNAFSLSLEFSSESSIKKEAWARIDGAVTYGTVAGLLDTVGAGETIYLQTAGPIVLSENYASALNGVTILPDPGIFSGGDYTVRIAQEGGGLQVAVIARQEISDDPGEMEIRAETTGIVGAWTTSAPVFALHASPSLPDGYAYGVSLNGGTAVALAGSDYTIAAEGQYTVRFAILDVNADAVCYSNEFSILFDATAPTLEVNVSTRESKIELTARDTASGVEALSTDGGATWFFVDTQIDGTARYELAAQDGASYPADTFKAKDFAGNIYSFAFPVSITSGGGMSGGFSGGMSGGSASSSRTVSHSSGSYSTTAYDAVELLVSDEPMDTLTIGGETLEMYLTENPDEPDAATGKFTASFTTWGTQETESDDTPDTLVLTAVLDETSSGNLQWSFNGSLYKKLCASGIDYLVLQADDTITAISTTGFTAGTLYNTLKQSGVSTRRFNYYVRMTAADQPPTASLSVEVLGDQYILTDDPSADIYYYNVFTGTTDIMLDAFGASIWNS